MIYSMILRQLTFRCIRRVSDCLHIHSLHTLTPPPVEASINDPTQIPDFDFSAFLLMPDGPPDSTSLDEPTDPTEPAPREHVVYEMLEHLTRLQSRLLNHRASLAEATTALHSGQALTVPFSEILEPFLSDTHQVADIAVYLNTQGSRFRHREKLLKTLSVDTSCLLLCSPVMLMLDLYKQLLSLIDAALAEGKPRSLFTAAENPACSCCAAISRLTWADMAPPNLVPSPGVYPDVSTTGNSASNPSTTPSSTTTAAAGAPTSPSKTASASSSNPSAPSPTAPSSTPILDAFTKLPERIGGFALSTSSSLSPGLRLWSLVGTLEFEVARLSQAVRVVEEKFPLVSIRGILKHTIASMREEMDAVLAIVGEVRGRCVVL